ncbi:MAG: hypothetical protein ACK5KR_09110 [Breznakia sp.]
MCQNNDGIESSCADCAFAVQLFRLHDFTNWQCDTASCNNRCACPHRLNDQTLQPCDICILDQE